jgi:hypothetical protein
MKEFRKGDVVVKIGDSNAYVICGSYRTSIWYSVQYLWSNRVFRSDVHIYTIDSDYVKVDFCKDPMNNDEVYAKLMPIARAFGKLGNE